MARGALLLGMSMLLHSAHARAQGGPPVSVTDTSTVTHTPPILTGSDKEEREINYWARGESRGFVSATVDAGYLYLRPRISVGYGRPFWKAVGIEAQPQVSQTFLGGYLGVYAALPFLEFRAGARYVWAFQKQFLVPQTHYDRLGLEARDTVRSAYLAGEAEVASTIPVGFGAILATANVSYITGVPKDVNGVPTELNVYEETLRVIVKPPWVWRGRLGYAVRLGIEGRVSLGVVVDVLGIVGRQREVLRAGIIGAAALSDHLEVLGSFVPPLFSPDTLGFAGGDFGQLGIRYRWSTDRPPPTPPRRQPSEPGEKEAEKEAEKKNVEKKKVEKP